MSPQSSKGGIYAEIIPCSRKPNGFRGADGTERHRAQADDAAYHERAKAYIAQATAPVTKWDGPTTGPKSVRARSWSIYVFTDQRNGGAQGVGDGAAEAAKALGWEFRILDGQGSVPGRTSAMTQAIALKPDGIILGSLDAVEQAPTIEEAVKAGIKVVGWHSGPDAWQDRGESQRVHQHDDRPERSRQGFRGFTQWSEGLAAATAAA